MNKVPVILGYSGHGFVFIEIAEGFGYTNSAYDDMEQKAVPARRKPYPRHGGKIKLEPI